MKGISHPMVPALTTSSFWLSRMTSCPSRALVIARVFVTDLRWKALVRGLDQLSNSGLRCLADHVVSGGGLALDTFNYDPRRGLWCPLAVAVGTTGYVQANGLSIDSNASGKALMLRLGRDLLGEFDDNALSGIPGRAFRDNRPRDISAALVGLVWHRVTHGASGRAATAVEVIESLDAACSDPIGHGGWESCLRSIAVDSCGPLPQ